MHPILFRIPFPGWNLPWLGVVTSIPIYSYGVMLGLSLVVGWYLTLALADRDGLPKETMANCYVATAVAAIIGSRLLYVVTNLDDFHSLKDVFAFRSGGLVAYGGFIGGWIGSWAYLKAKRIPLLPWADVAVPSLATGLFITRIGCYLFGCDFGARLSDSAPAFLKKIGTFPHWAEGTLEHGSGSPAWVHHVTQNLIERDSVASLPVHPTQLYESFVGLSIFGLLMLQRRNQKFRGQVALLFFFAYGFLRFLLELVRDDAERGVYGPKIDGDIMIPGGLLLFAIGYVVAFSNTLRNRTLRLATQVVAFVPAIVSFILLRPGAFLAAEKVQYSTSQWVALLSALVVCGVFPVLWKAAEDHPEEAMALNLTEFYDGERGAEPKAEASEEAAEEEEEEEQEVKPKKKAKKSKGRTEESAKPAVEAKFDDDEAKEGSKSEIDAKASELAAEDKAETAPEASKSEEPKAETPDKKSVDDPESTS